MKKVVKKFKPDFKVDLTDVEYGSDVYAAVVDAKAEKGLPITANEFAIYIEQIVTDAVKATIEIFTILDEEEEPIKKPNIFKRFWNWITRKK